MTDALFMFVFGYIGFMTVSALYFYTYRNMPLWGTIDKNVLSLLVAEQKAEDIKKFSPWANLHVTGLRIYLLAHRLLLFAALSTFIRQGWYLYKHGTQAVAIVFVPFIVGVIFFIPVWFFVLRKSNDEN